MVAQDSPRFDPKLEENKSMDDQIREKPAGKDGEIGDITDEDMIDFTAQVQKLNMKFDSQRV